MDVRTLLPAADSLPASPLFFEVLGALTFAVHLLLMNMLLGLVLIGLARSLPAGPRPPGLGQQAALIPLAAALAVNFGVAPLLFVQVLYGQFLYVSSTLMGVYWFGLMLAVMLAYALAYRQKAVLCRGEGKGVALWALMAGCLLYSTFVQTQNALLLLNPHLWEGYFQKPDGTLLAWSDPTLAPRWLHFVIGSLALGGIALAMTGRKRTRKNDPHGAELTRQGLAWFCWATVAQMVDGLWFLMALPREVMLSFMGGNPVASALLLLGIGLATLALVFGFRARLMPASGAAVATVLVMVAIREAARQAYLAPFFDAAALPVRPEPSTVALFLGCFTCALAVIWWAMRHPATDCKGA